MRREENLIGITEAGDAGRDLSWAEKLQDHKYAGAILITKSGDLPAFQRAVLALKKPCIIHFTCTGWGGTAMEPNVTPVEDLFPSIRSFLDHGFPAERAVLRVDPIIPTVEGYSRLENVLQLYKEFLPDIKRIRISIYDDYHQAREEMIRRGYPPVDGITRWKNESQRRPSQEQVQRVAKLCVRLCPDQHFEVCAEPELAAWDPGRFTWTGCVSEQDCEILGVEVPDDLGRRQSRFGCRCISNKRELLSCRNRCPNNCAYCYWGGQVK